jgi:hypothetical protein
VAVRTVTLQDAILAVMHATPQRAWTVQQVVAVVDYADIVAPGDRSGFPTLSHRVRKDLSKLNQAGSVIRLRRDRIDCRDSARRP